MDSRIECRFCGTDMKIYERKSNLTRWYCPICNWNIDPKDKQVDDMKQRIDICRHCGSPLLLDENANFYCTDENCIANKNRDDYWVID